MGKIYFLSLKVALGEFFLKPALLAQYERRRTLRMESHLSG